MVLNFNINLLKISYLFHFVLLGIIIMFNLFYKKSIIWISSSQNMLFLIFIFLLFIPMASPIIFLIITFINKTYKTFFGLLKVGFIITFFSILIAIGILIVFSFIIKDYSLFYKNCPFNFDLYDIQVIFGNFLNNKNININNKISELKDKCSNRRCIFQNSFSSDYIEDNYFYICNYNSSEDFLNNKENEILCETFNSKDEIDSQYMKIYINLCNSLIDFYLCKLKKIPKKYQIKSDYICPTNKDKSVALEIIISLLNIIIPLSIYLVQFVYYKKIMKLIVTMNINRPANEHNENGGTEDTSRKTELKNSNSFKKENTQLIIIDKKKIEDEIFNIYNKDKYKKTKKRNIINNKTDSLLLNKTTVKDISLLNVEITKSKEKNKNNFIIDIDEKNKSFTNSNSNYLNNNKITLLDSMRVLTETNKNEINEKNQKKNNDLNEACKIKYIAIKK